MKNKPPSVPIELAASAQTPARILEYVQFRDGVYLGPAVELLTEARAPQYHVFIEVDATGPTVFVRNPSTQAHARVPLGNVAAYRVALLGAGHDR